MADGSKAHVFSESDIKTAQRTAAGVAYEKERDALFDRLNNDEAFRKERVAFMNRIRAVGPSQVHSNAFMTNMSVMYKNDDYIGEQLMPVVSVPKMSDNFPTYDKRDRTGAPEDTLAGPGSDVNEINEDRGSDSYSLKPYGLKNSVSSSTIENQDPAFDELVDLIEAINEDLALHREVRCMTALTTAANYGGNTAALAGGDRWDTSTSDPLKNIQSAIAECWQGKGPGKMVAFTNLEVWNYLSRHPQLLDLFKYTSPGLTKMDAVARELGLSKLLVGAARRDTANKGQSASYSRIWPKSFGVVRVADRPTLRNASFGYTIRFKGHPVTHQWFDPTKGVTGSYVAKIGLYEQQKVVAGTTGFLLTTVIS